MSDESLKKSSRIHIDYDFLAAFEKGINAIHPQQSAIPAEVLGYGEMSTVLAIPEGDPGVVYKRMPMFHGEAETRQFINLYEDSQQYLQAAGIVLVPAAAAYIVPHAGNVVLYIIQKKFDAGSVAHRAIHHLHEAQVERLFAAILKATGQVFDFNGRQDQIQLGFDAQISNWAIAGYEPQSISLPEPINLVYIDTSSPLVRIKGEEQLDPEIFLRSTPPYLRWIVRWLFLDDILNRYYDHKKVIVDILANLYKEQRPEIIPSLIKTANNFLQAHSVNNLFEPITEKEIADYYKEDAFIWRLYFNLRRFDRRLHLLFKRPYPYVLPGHTAR